MHKSRNQKHSYWQTQPQDGLRSLPLLEVSLLFVLAFNWANAGLCHGANGDCYRDLLSARIRIGSSLVVAKSTALSAKNGLLIKNRTAFENARKITTIVFDKTGTLTVGKFDVSKIVSLKEGFTENEIIRLAAALEQNSEHPIATGILKKAKDLSISIPVTESFNAITGKGIEATVEGKKYLWSARDI